MFNREDVFGRGAILVEMTGRTKNRWKMLMVYYLRYDMLVFNFISIFTYNLCCSRTGSF